MLQRLYSFRARHQPFMVRHSYTHELRSAATFPLAASLAEGAFTGVIAAKSFNAPIILMSVITAAPMFGNIAALFWSELSSGRRKVPLVNLMQLGVLLMIASVALTSLLPAAMQGWVFAGQIIIARILASGIVTVRSSIWRVNYPREVRAQVTSRIAVVATTVLAATTFVGSYLLDRDSNAYVYLYPSAALIGLFGIHQFSKVRVRREPMLLRQEQQVYAPRPENIAHTDESNVLNYQPSPQGWTWHRVFGQAWQILREDKDFRDYQRWQFVSGTSMMMSTPALIYMVSTRLTDPNRDYLLATIVLQIVPMATALLFAQLWAPLFDRLHITQFRIWQGLASTAALLVIYFGAMWGSAYGDIGAGALAIVAVGQVLLGVSQAGGGLAWNLGHNDFAPAGKASVYMGVHVMLTGLRGSFAPFVGSWLYAQAMVGRHIFAVSVVVSLISVVGFWSMSRRLRQHPAPARLRRSPLAPGRRPSRLKPHRSPELVERERLPQLRDDRNRPEKR